MSIRSYSAKPAFSKRFTSSPQTITSGGLLMLAHDLGEVPKFYNLSLKCVTADVNSGWAVGDIVSICVKGQSDDTVGCHLSIYADANNVYVRYGSNMAHWAVGDKASGAAKYISLANFKFILEAWA